MERAWSYNCASSPTHDYTLVSYAMGTCGLPDIYTLSPWACGPQAYISGKPLVPMVYVTITYIQQPIKLRHTCYTMSSIKYIF